ncbi:MAG: hypothetical protein CBARDCOR_6162 [uncultured Caballeronia sp.]|nr:MAG: hypothetical protein CBARDCOR_6162 [uncultured Caballeronia sp.]
MGGDQQSSVSVVLREFIGRQTETQETITTLPAESQAALRQFSPKRGRVWRRLRGCHRGELRGRVLAGKTWSETASSLAVDCLRHADSALAFAGTASRAVYLRRSSALLRMSQMMLLSDTDERRSIFAKVTELYRQSGELLGDRQHVRRLARWGVTPKSRLSESLSHRYRRYRRLGHGFRQPRRSARCSPASTRLLDGPS